MNQFKKHGMRFAGCALALLMLLAATGCQGLMRAAIDAVGEEVGTALTEEQSAKLAFGAVLSTRNNMHDNTLFGMNNLYLEALETSVEQSWGIDDRASAIETLDWLKEEGHRLPSSPEYYGYDEIYDIITGREAADESILAMFAMEIEGYEAICQGLIADYGYTQEEIDAVATMSAWDYDRLVTVARWCGGLGYITEDEAWEYIDSAVLMARSDYTSWREYFAGVLFGRTIWAEDGEFSADDQEIAKKLLADKDSVYETVAFYEYLPEAGNGNA